MKTVLLIIGIGALIGFSLALASGEKPKDAAGAAIGGAFMAGGCLLQLLIPAVLLIAGLALLRLIIGW